MKEKYKSWPHFFLARLYRSINRFRVSRVFSWTGHGPLEDGVTIIIGMSSRLPFVLPANLRCLQTALWPQVKQIIICAEAKELLPQDFELKVKAQFPGLNIQFLYYDRAQRRLAEKTQLPYVLSWLSWVKALDKCRTKTAFLHDYDALVFGNVLEQRYRQYLETKSLIQGVEWYKINGISPEDKLVCTFETFLDVAWIKSFPPVTHFNRVAIFKGRRVDFDSFLDVQATHTAEDRRTIAPMQGANLIHPTQMISQYSMARRLKGLSWHCIALVMIPFFYYLSGKEDFFEQTEKRIRAARGRSIDLLGNGEWINFSQLSAEGTGRMLKLMVQACLNLKIGPLPGMVKYIEAFYDFLDAPAQQRWAADFSAGQKEWISAARAKAG